MKEELAVEFSIEESKESFGENFEGFNLLLNAVLNPREVIRYLNEFEPKKYFWLFILIACMDYSFEKFAIMERSSSGINLIIVLVFSFLFAIISVLIMSGGLRIFANIIKGKGDYDSMVTSIIWGNMPSILFAPVMLITYILTIFGKGNVLNTIVMILEFIAFIPFIWSGINTIRMISESEELSIGQVLKILILPTILVVIIIAFLSFLIGFITGII